MTNNPQSQRSVSPTGGGLAVLSLPRPTILALALSVIVLALLAPALGGDYIWDDLALVKDNPLVHGFTHWTQWFSRSLFATRLEDNAQSSGAQYFRPIVLLSFALDNEWSGNNPAIAHATNLIFYAGVVVASFFTLIRWHALTYGALVAIAWFALHPTHVESSAWISGRTDLFALLGILIASFGAARRIGLRKRSYLAFEILGTVLAYGSKENAIVLPAFYAIEVWVVLGRPVLYISTICEIGKKVLPQILIAGTFLALRILFLPFFTDEIANAPPIPFVSHVQMFLETCGRGAMLTIFPWPLRGQHGLISVSAGGLLELSLGYVVLGALTALTLTTATVVLFKRRPAIAIALLAFAFCFAPVSNLLPSRLQCLFFERYLVIPHLFAAWLLAILVDAAFNALQKKQQRWQTTAAALLVGIGLFSFAWLTRERALDYSDAERFWTHELKYNRLSSVAASNLADLPLNRNRPVELVRLLSRCYENANLRRQIPEANSCLFRAFIILGRRTPDGRVETLRAIAAELSLLLTGESATKDRRAVKSKLGNFRLSFTPNQVKRLIAAYPGQIEAELSVLYSRLNHTEMALSYAERSLSLCTGCRWTAPLSLVYATAYEYTKAKNLLNSVRSQIGPVEVEPFLARIETSEVAFRTAQSTTGPIQIHAKAERLIALAQYGLAYQVLSPVKSDFINVFDVATGYAQIAYFSGYESEALSILRQYLPPEGITSTVAKWNDEFALIR